MRRRASGLLRLGRKYSPRALHPERSLAEHYNPLAMTPELVKAHDALDREVDKAMGRRASSLRSGSARSYCLPITRNSPTTSSMLVRIGRTHVASAARLRLPFSTTGAIRFWWGD